MNGTNTGASPSLAEAMREATVALSMDNATGMHRGTSPMEIFRPALVDVGARPQDLDLHHQVRTADSHWSHNTRETSAKALVTTLSDYAMAGIDTTALSLRDAICWAIATEGEPEALATVARWVALSPHGWLLHAAGLAPDEALGVDPIDVHRLYAMTALRGRPVPAWTVGEPLVWPRIPEPPHRIA